MRSVVVTVHPLVLSVFLAHLFIIGCSTIRDREVTAENTEEVMRELGQSRDVTPEEAQLVVGSSKTCSRTKLSRAATLATTTNSCLRIGRCETSISRVGRCGGSRAKLCMRMGRRTRWVDE